MTTDTVGGVFTYSTELAAELTGREAEVAIVTFGREPSDDQRRQLARAGVERVVETELALEWMPEPWRDLATAERLLLELERELASDVVHLNAFAHGGAPFRAPALVVGHSCVFSWWAAVHGSAPSQDWDRYRTVVRRGLAGAAAVVAPTRTMLSELKRCYGPLRGPAQVILNGSGVAETAGLTGRDPIVLGSGRLWDEAKNAAALHRVARRPALRDRVLLAGESGDGAAEAGAARLLGRLASERLAELRRRATVYAAPARYEPFGLGILEAARDACALVLGDIPSLRELWNGAGLFVDPDDDAGLGDTLEMLLAHPNAAAAWGRRARERSRAYDAAAMGEAYLDLYGRLSAAEGMFAA
ncbi:MAG TPA: glycosyltransferase family 4 protein [Solirubrobacteraceae bacterium]|jgi:glycosyltransferase involved in cell wall biosynthesis|nr:glycosyltransferase family 4 protein [Solirubrobacteraceae bacterium]